MNVKDINEIHECFWHKNADGEDVLRFRGSVSFTFEAKPGRKAKKKKHTKQTQDN